jgi:hypothetical protein
VADTGKTESEKLFEDYLSRNGYDDWDFEPKFEGRARHPDYLIRAADRKFLCEVKELHKLQPVPQRVLTGCDPYKAIRDKIEKAREKFKEYRDWCCSLVVYNVDNWESREDPERVYAAMLGDLGFTMQLDTSTGVVDESSFQEAFLKRGKMIRPKTTKPQNTTVSAIIILEHYEALHPDFLHAFNMATAEAMERLDHMPTVGEKMDIRIRVSREFGRPVTHCVPRLRVHENPFACIPFPMDMFRGPYDERWRYEEPHIQRIYVGDRLQGIEALQAEEPGDTGWFEDEKEGTEPPP